MITSRESRNEGIELLRIVAMAMIVAVHFSVSHSDIYSGNQAADFVNRYLYFSVVGGVDIFAIISGWVMCQRTPNPDRLLKIWVQCIFYNIILFCLYNMTYSEFPWTKLLYFLQPISRNTYWYLTAYFGMFLFLPLINKSLQMLPQKDLCKILLFCFVLFSCQGTIFSQKDLYQLRKGFSVLWILICYVWGSCLCLLFRKKKIRKTFLKFCILGVHVIFLLMSVIKSLQIYRLNTILDSVALYISPLYLIYATSLLLLFEQISIENSKIKKIIYKIASTTLGIYIIQMHPLVYRRIFNSKFYMHLALKDYLIEVLFVIIGVLILGCLLDLVRIKLFGLLRIDLLLDYVYGKLNMKLNTLLKKLRDFSFKHCI